MKGDEIGEMERAFAKERGAEIERVNLLLEEKVLVRRMGCKVVEEREISNMKSLREL